MSANLATLAGQRAAQRLMVDSCTISRSPGTLQPLDPQTLQRQKPTTQVYSGACRVKPWRITSDQVVETGETTKTLVAFVVSVPMSVTDLHVNDVITVTACALDPNLVGEQLRVRDVNMGTHVSARRLGCELIAKS